MSKSIDKILKKDKYMDCIRDLIDHEKVQEMNNYIQHGNTTTLDHCIRVSYTSYKISKFFKMDYKSTARAALLHDLYLYDWHKNDEKTIIASGLSGYFDDLCRRHDSRVARPQCEPTEP